MASSAPAKDGSGARGGAHKQGRNFHPMDKNASQTVKLNPKLELSHTELLKLLSYMEAELQARDVVIATLKTERIKSLLAYGRGGVHDPVLALQRDTSHATVSSAKTGPDTEIRCMQTTQLTQLEHLIAQQRKAHLRMRLVLREAEKRHCRVVGELEEERRKHEHDISQGDDVTYALEKDRSHLKQTIESERSLRRAAEVEVARVTIELEEQRQQHKQIVLLLLEDRHRISAQATHHRQRAEQLAKLVNEEKGRIDGMAEGLEEESKKSLQMEAELEKQLAQFDTERQQMRALLQRRDERVVELESQVEKLQQDVSHYQKQLQEAHNVAMFQQSVSASRIPTCVAPSVVNSLLPTGILTSPAAAAASTLPTSANLMPVSASLVTGVPTPNVVAIPSLSIAASVCNSVNSNTLPARLQHVKVVSSNRPTPPQLPAKPPQLSHVPTRGPGPMPPPKVSSRLRTASPCGDEALSLTSSHSSNLGSISSHSLSTTPPSSVLVSSLGAQDSSPASISKAVQLTATINSVPVSMPSTGIARAVQAPYRATVFSTDESQVSSATGNSTQIVQLSPRVNASVSAGKVISANSQAGGGKFTFQTPLSVQLKPQRIGAQTLKLGLKICKSSSDQRALESKKDLSQVPQTT